MEVTSLLKDLNLLYKYGNIHLSEDGQIEFKNISEIIESKNSELQNNSILENNNYSDGNISMFGTDPDAPVFALESKAKANVNYLKKYEKDLMNLMIKYPNSYIIPALQTNVEFASKVAEGQPWDYKRAIGWNKYRTCTINGKQRILKGEDIGNIHYGYVGTSRGFSTTTLCKAGGLVQVITSKGGSLKQFTYKSYYDDPNDQVAIKRGTSWYNTGSFK